MGYNGKITTPVSIPDVQQALGVGSNDLGTLCKSTKINMWAKFKPIYCSGVLPITNKRRANKNNSERSVSGYSISYGIMKPNVSEWSQYIDTSTGEISSNPWKYDKPEGGESSPYRLSDFVEVNDSNQTTGYGYDPNAVCPIELHFDNSSYLIVPMNANSNGTVMRFLFTFQNGVNWDPTTCLSLEETFSNVLSYYPTVIMTCWNGGRVWEYTKSGDSTIQDTIDGRGNPIVWVDINTEVFCAALNTSYHSGPLANDVEWTCCMLLTSQKIAGTKDAHILNAGNMLRLEYEKGVDTKTYMIKNVAPIDDVTALKYTVTLTQSSSNSAYYYISSLLVELTTSSGDEMNIQVGGSFTCLVGVIGGTGWSGNNQQESKTNWTSIKILSNERDRTVSKAIRDTLPEYRFTGGIGPNNDRIAAGTITFYIGTAATGQGTEYKNYISGNYTINVAGGASSYTETVIVKPAT